MNDKKFIKELLQYQHMRLNHPDFTIRVMEQISALNNRKKRFIQLISVTIISVLAAWVYLSTKPYLNHVTSLILSTREAVHIGFHFISLKYIVYLLVWVIAIYYFFYERKNIIKR